MKEPMHIDHFMVIVRVHLSMGDALPKALERTERIHQAFVGARRYTDLAEAERVYQHYQRQYARR